MKRQRCLWLGLTALVITACSPPPFPLEAEATVDNGDIVIKHVPPEDSTYRDLHQALQQSQEFEEIATDLNTQLTLPQNLAVHFQECGESNAFYDPERNKIELCYELIQTYLEIFGDPDPSSIETEAVHVSLFTFFHELGHALIDQYQLPITGSEEDAADEFAALMLLDARDDNAILAALDQFDVDAEAEAELEQLPFWSEHSLSAQRYYKTACIIYGSNPRAFAELAGSDELPRDRARQCRQEYRRRRNSWDALLSPYLKQKSRRAGATDLVRHHAYTAAKPLQTTPPGSQESNPGQYQTVEAQPQQYSFSALVTFVYNLTPL